MSTTLQNDTALVLRGIDGTNPLGFMAAVGLLRLVDGALREHHQDRRAGEGPALRWVVARGSWRPEIRGGGVSDVPALVALVLPRLKRIFGRPPFVAEDGVGPIGDTLKVLPGEFRAMAEVAARHDSVHDHEWSDWLAALASETATRANAPECMKCSFDFTAANQKFLPMARNIIKQCDERRLERCLSCEWDYPDRGESLRWDPFDEGRRYALSAIDPGNSSKNPIRTDFAANAVAFASLPAFPMVRGVSIGFTRHRDAFRWPLWEDWVPASSVTAVMALSVAAIDSGDPETLAPRGIAAVYESPVVLPVGYYRNFTPSRRIA